MALRHIIVFLLCCCGQAVSPTPRVEKFALEPTELAVPLPRKNIINSTASSLLCSNEQLLMLGSIVQRLTNNTLATYPTNSIDLGPIKSAAPRQNKAWVLSQNGLFYDEGTMLLRSPVSTSIDVSNFTNISSYGEGESEEVWLYNQAQALFVSGLNSVSLKLTENETALPIESLVARANKTALVISLGRIFILDVKTSTAQAIFEGVSTAAHSVRVADVVWFGSATGLIAVSSDNSAKYYSYNDAPIQAIATNGVDLIFIVQNKLMRKSATGFEIIGTVATPKPAGLSLMKSGRIYALDANVLVQFGSDDVVVPKTSFATDVVPFVNAHCMTCHRAQVPVRAFDTLGVATVYADDIVNRLQSLGNKSPMPPPDREVLSAAQYDVFLRWVNEGKLP
jgi:hypothetical protein